jgi:poly(3-hydroxybutyrate) depolymerase
VRGTTPAAAAIPAGTGRLALDLGGVELEVFTYKPASYRGERMLIVCHGILRNADEYRDHACGMADRFGALVVAPKFDAERFPSRRYQQGGILRPDGSAAPPEEWTYALIPQLAQKVRELEPGADPQLFIIGHSAGGQFVMRMSAFQDTGAVRLVAANPGSTLMPVRALRFGYGFDGLPDELADEQALRRYLAAPLTIYLGTADDVPDDDFDRSAQAMQQGNGRHQRGLACYWTARTLARERGWEFAWRLVEAPGVAHDHQAMFDHAHCERALFGTPAEPAPGK